MACDSNSDCAAPRRDPAWLLRTWLILAACRTHHLSGYGKESRSGRGEEGKGSPFPNPKTVALTAMACLRSAHSDSMIILRIWAPQERLRVLEATVLRMRTCTAVGSLVRPAR